MADTTGRIPLWIIGIVAGIVVIDLIGIFFMVHIRDWDHPCNNWKNFFFQMKA